MTIRIRYGSSIRSLLLSLLISLASASVAIGALIGDRNQLDAILAELVEPLHQKGIDVVAGDASAVNLTRRPRVAMLSGMPVRQPADFRWLPWMTAFESGAVGVVAGVKLGDARGDKAPGEFVFGEIWRDTARDKRVFLSFTSADVEAAEKVELALQKQGYITFMFLNSSDRAPRYSAETTGRFFSQAGHFLVLDTTDARESHGVWLEASISRRFTGGLGDDGGFPTRPGDEPRPGGPGRPSVGSGIATIDAPEFSEREFLAGVRGSWIVTENPEFPGKLFVHRAQRDGYLVGLLYRVQVENDGSWTVYRPSASTPAGSLGARQGRVARPSGVSIGPCGCR